jgi:dihydrofolate reductase
MKLTSMTQVTVDGVMQGNGHATDEERMSGFERGGWATGAFSDETGAFITETYQRADAFLFGRKTYEMFAETWGTVEEMRTHPIGVALNNAPKYVASTTLTEPLWENTTVLSGDLPEVVREIKARPGGEVQVHGSGALIRSLLASDLVDEMTLLVVPLVLGQGDRLFPHNGLDIALDVVESRIDSKGVAIQVYRPSGRPRYSPNW